MQKQHIDAWLRWPVLANQSFAYYFDRIPFFSLVEIGFIVDGEFQYRRLPTWKKEYAELIIPLKRIQN